MSNKTELIKKIKKLASEGYYGEKDNAEEIINKLMKKYKISEESLNDDVPDWYKFNLDKKYRDLSKRLMLQLIVVLFGEGISCLPNRPSFISFKLTRSQFIEFSSQYEFYMARLKEKMELAYLAFIDVNHLFYKCDKGVTLSAEELQKRRKASEIARSLDRDVYHKQISKN